MSREEYAEAECRNCGTLVRSRHGILASCTCFKSCVGGPSGRGFALDSSSYPVENGRKYLVRQMGNPEDIKWINIPVDD